MPPDERLLPLARAIARVRRRVRLELFSRAFVGWAGPSLAVGAAALAALGVRAIWTADHGYSAAPLSLPVALTALGVAVLAGCVAAARPRSEIGAAQRLDEAGRTESRMTNAWSLAQISPRERSAFADAAIADAVAHLAALDPVRAAPLTRPSGLTALGLAAAALALAATLRVAPTAERARVPPPPPRPAPLADPDELAALREELEAAPSPPDEAPTLRRARQELATLLTDLERRRLDEREALERADALSQRFLRDRPEERGMRTTELAELADAFDAGPLQEAAEALREGSAARAAEATRSAADRIASDTPDRRALDRLRRALARAARQADAHPERAAQAAREREERLLRRDQQRPASPARERLLRRRRRELDRLRREEARQRAQRRELERLSRELSRAAEGAERRSPGETSEAMRRAAEALNRMARNRQQDQRSQQLARQIEQLRELLRRSRSGRPGSSGGGRGRRLRRFRLQAGGQPLGVGRRPSGTGSAGRGSGGMAAAGSGMAGPGGMGGAGMNPGGMGATVLQLGGGGQADALLELPGQGAGQRPGGAGSGEPGPGAGSDHDGSRLDVASELRHRTRDSRVEGQASEGPTRSEVIGDAAARGFVGSGYRRVFEDYRGHAERVIERDQVPPGYRFYVRRYFQLIRPRQNGQESE